MILVRWILPFLLLSALLSGLLLSQAAQAEMVLNRGNGAEPETLDPHQGTGFPEALIIYDLFEGLTARGPDGRWGPGLAERWTISEDGLVQTYFLRRQGRWSDGTPITAEDVVFSIRRIIDPIQTQGRHAHYFWPLRNARAITDGRITDLTQLGVRAVDPYTVQFLFDRPAPYFPSLLSFPFLVPLPKAALERHGKAFFKAGNLVSSGGYMLAEVAPQSYVKLVRNPRHRDAARTRIDTVYFHATENQDTELLRFRAGELDTTFSLRPPQIPWAREKRPQDLRIGPQLGTFYYAPNLTREPWKSNLKLRQALALAIDRPMLAEKIAQGGEIPSYSYVPPGLPDYTPQQPDWAGWPRDRQMAEARRLLAEAGWPDGKAADGTPLSVEILYNTSENWRRVAVATAGMWQQVLGIQTVLTNLEWKVFLDHRRTKNFAGVTRQGYVGAYDDANVFLEFLHSGAGPENPSSYAKPAFEALIDQAGLETDQGRRRSLLERAERMALDDMAVIPVFTLARARLVSTRVQGWVVNPLDCNPTRFLSVE
jgi:oligopeptide transport system substrate-binding protein